MNSFGAGALVGVLVGLVMIQIFVRYLKSNIRLNRRIEEHQRIALKHILRKGYMERFELSGDPRVDSNIMNIALMRMVSMKCLSHEMVPAKDTDDRTREYHSLTDEGKEWARVFLSVNAAI